jgi:3-demethoxyubiquinol 3-hydroxylase
MKRPASRPNPVDLLIGMFDRALRASTGLGAPAQRPDPANGIEENSMSQTERALSIALLRVDHAGEVAAQALYEGQALTARSEALKAHLQEAAAEEGDHLAWCAARLRELGGRPSYLGPLWYSGSLTLGAMAGRAGDRWSLGFLAETETQVTNHLEAHLAELPAGDHRSRAILEQMRVDEHQHASAAVAQGAATLPAPVRHLMQAMSKVMTLGARWV